MALSPDLRQKLEELLEKYSSGLWAHALPKLFQDTYKVGDRRFDAHLIHTPEANVDTIIMFSCFFYKTKLPGHVLGNLDLLADICTIDYPMPDNPKRAILYRRSSAGGGEDENCNRRSSSTSEEELRARAELGRRLSNHEVPPLQIPKEEYPSVLVMEATNTNAVILRWEKS